ncbi:hypothetical protein EYC84_002837 [Monilinia fructicola]|uniref:Uncharacterized protein n=1 Tax=Monilinia fructicola TaxID=38448 RepID=A0A5M9JUQ5_MONFR|nr:hypothetical protein EYC84_002837 [Monilinia fructicola]
MADVEEPQFTTLSQRIAALKQQQHQQPAQILWSQNNALTVAKRPPPPPPPPPIPSSDRPPLPTRPKTANNPPVLTYGSSVTQKPFNEPIATNTNSYPSPPNAPKSFDSSFATKEAIYIYTIGKEGLGRFNSFTSFYYFDNVLE